MYKNVYIYICACIHAYIYIMKTRMHIKKKHINEYIHLYVHMCTFKYKYLQNHLSWVTEILN